MNDASQGTLAIEVRDGFSLANFANSYERTMDDIIWWGILNLFVVEIGGISPPFGLTMYVLKGFQDVPMATIFKSVTPFCFAAIVVLVILTLFPSITLWLPSTMVN